MDIGQSFSRGLKVSTDSMFTVWVWKGTNIMPNDEWKPSESAGDPIGFPTDTQQHPYYGGEGGQVVQGYLAQEATKILKETSPDTSSEDTSEE